MTITAADSRVHANKEHPRGQPDAAVPSSSGGIIIAVMGVTGSGKSSLIKEITGISEIEVSDGLNACTAKITPYTFQHEGTTLTLLDTPGFNDTHRSDTEILKEISEWTSITYKANLLLTGIIYLHRISDIRMEGSSLRSLSMFRKMVGENGLENVLLTTTHWSRVTPEEGDKREKELRESQDFWRGLLHRGATYMRYGGDRKSGLELLRKLIPCKPIVLDIQDQIVNQGIALIDTPAGQLVHKVLNSTQKKLETELGIVRDELRQALDSKDDEMKKILAEEQKKIAAKIEKLEKDRNELKAENQWHQRSLLSPSINELELLLHRPVLLIYVKATGELGNVGHSGSLFVSMINAKLRSEIAIQGAGYNALTSSLALLEGGSNNATRKVLNYIRKGISSSPNKRIFLCGYSQGAMIIRKAAGQLTDEERTRINGIVFFGDPSSLGSKLPTDLDDRLLNIRLPLDWVHLPIPVLTSTHLLYFITFPEAIRFIQKKIRG